VNRDVTITQTDVTLRRNDRPIELTQASAEIVAVGVAGPQGATGVVAAGAPITYNAGTQTVGIALGTGLTTTGGTVNVTKVVTTADAATTALEAKPTGDEYPRTQIAASGKIWSQPSKFAPFTGRHNTTNVGYGSDTQVYMERSDLVSTILTLRMNRFQAITGAEAQVTSGTFPMTNGTVVLADSSAFPAITSGTAYGVLSYQQINDPLTTAGALSGNWTNRTPFAAPTAAFTVTASGARCSRLDSPSIATVETGEVNHEVTCRLSGTLADNMGIVVRYNDIGAGAAAWVSIRYNTATAKIDAYAQFRSTGGTITGTYLGSSTEFFVTGNYIKAIVDENRLAVYLGQVDDQGEIQYATPDVYTLTDARSLVGKNAGLWRNSAATTTALYSQFSVEASKTFSYTSKSGLELRGVTCATAKNPVTASATTLMSYTDTAPVQLVSAVDSNGAVIWRLKNFGGQHTTDNITMGRNDDSGDVGLMFQSDSARTDSGLVFLGDSAPTGTSSASGNRGTFIRRVAARLLRVGGRMHIAPSDITNYDGEATGNGTAAAPHLGIGNVDTGLYLTTAANVDTLNVAADGANIATFAASGATVNGQAVVVTNDARLTNDRTPTSHASTHASGGSDPITVAPSQVTGTAVVTADSRLSDSRTPTSHASTHASGGSDPLTAASTSVVGVVQLTDSTTSTSTTTAATANAVKTAVERVRDSLSSSSSALDVYSRTSTLGGVASVSGTVYFTFFTPATNMTITTISYAVAATTSSGLTLSRFGLYTFDGTTATLVARTNSTATTTFNTANTVYARTFDTTGGYPASYDLVAGTRYAIALIGVGTTPGNIVGATGVATVLALAPRLNGALASQSDLPTSTSSFGAPTALYWGRVS
jgi:hypothetical protein